MPGMGRSLQTGNSLIVSTFHTTLFHQLLVVLLVVAVCAIGFNVVRTVQYRRLKPTDEHVFPSLQASTAAEPVARRVVRIGFGCLWILDGLLQLQSSMPLGLPSGVVQPASSTSPAWVQHLVNSGVTIWSNHPIQAAAATVWIQLGLGHLAAGRTPRPVVTARRAGEPRLGPRGVGLRRGVRRHLRPGRDLALRGAGRRALLLRRRGPRRAARARLFTPRLGRAIVGAGGVFLIGMAVLQAWPGRGYWQGRGGTLTAMVQQMAQTSQPGFLSSWLSSFGSFVRARLGGQPLRRRVAGGHRRSSLSGRRRLVLAGWSRSSCSASPTGSWSRTSDSSAASAPIRTRCCPWPSCSRRATSPWCGAGARRMRSHRPDPGASTVERRPAHRRWWDRVTLPYLVRSLAAVAALGIVLVGTAPDGPGGGRTGTPTRS